MTQAVRKLDHVTEDGICKLVDMFYVKVRADPELGPIFGRVVVDWPPHLKKMYAFWSSVMLTTGRYKGNPMLKHMAIPELQPEMFARWLALFSETCTELFDDQVSNAFQIRAERIAESLSLAIFHRLP